MEYSLERQTMSPLSVMLAELTLLELTSQFIQVTSFSSVSVAMV